LGRYREDATGAVRTIVALAGADGSTVVVDRLAGTKADARVVACIAADEEPSNVRLIAQLYLGDETRGRCRELTSDDLSASAEQGAGEIGQTDTGEAPDYSSGSSTRRGCSTASASSMVARTVRGESFAGRAGTAAASGGR
jgi:hypothetical protein